MPFAEFLKGFSGDPAPRVSFKKTYYFWKTLSEFGLHCLDKCCLPTALRDDAFARWKEVNTFPFLELPPELRERIISIALMLPVSGSMTLDPFGGMYSDFPKKRNVALLRTSQQAYHEAASILYKRVCDSGVPVLLILCCPLVAPHSSRNLCSSR